MEPGKIPNLDAMHADDIEEAAETFESLAKYGRLKCRAVRARTAGKIAQAAFFEEQAELVFFKLPAWAKW